MTYIHPKILRETLCMAQSCLSEQHSIRLQELIDQIDRHRPIGSDCKHGSLHTPTCGCDGHTEAWSLEFS